MASTRRRRVAIVRMEDSDSDRTSVCEDETFDMSLVETEEKEDEEMLESKRAVDEGEEEEDEEEEEEETEATPADSLSMAEDEGEGEASSTSSGVSKPKRAMTARQRALVEGKRRRHLAEVAKRKRYQETVPLTEEEILKAKRLAIRRRELARAKDEKEKRETVNRLLKFKSSPATATRGSSASSPAVEGGPSLLASLGEGSTPAAPATPSADDDRPPMIRFVSNADGTSYSLPPGFPFPLEAAVACPERPEARRCVIPGCGQARKYAGKQTGHSVCSLQCYRADLARQTA